MPPGLAEDGMGLWGSLSAQVPSPTSTLASCRLACPTDRSILRPGIQRQGDLSPQLERELTAEDKPGFPGLPAPLAVLTSSHTAPSLLPLRAGQWGLGFTAGVKRHLRFGGNKNQRRVAGHSFHPGPPSGSLSLLVGLVWGQPLPLQVLKPG